MLTKVTVNFACGHTAAVGLKGTPEEVQARVEKLEKKGLCPECLSKQKNNKNNKKTVNNSENYKTPKVGPYMPDKNKKNISDPAPDAELSKTCLRLFIKESKYKKFFSDCKTEKSVKYPDSGKIYVYIPYERMMAILAKKILDENPDMRDRQPFLDGAACYAELFGRKSAQNTENTKEDKIVTPEKPPVKKEVPAAPPARARTSRPIKESENKTNKNTEAENKPVTPPVKVAPVSPAPAKNTEETETTVDDFFKEIGYNTGFDADMDAFVEEVNGINTDKKVEDFSAEEFVPQSTSLAASEESEPEEIKFNLIDDFTDSVLGGEEKADADAALPHKEPVSESVNASPAAPANSADASTGDTDDDDFDPYADF